MIRSIAAAALVTLPLVIGCAKPAAEQPPAPEGAATPSTEEAASELAMIDPPAGPGAMAPRLAAAGDGLLLSWLEPEGGGHRFLIARLDPDLDWSEPTEVAAGEGFFANWADVPAVAEAAGGALFATWLEKLGDDTYAYGARLATSEDGGASWRDHGLLHDDDSPTEHGFVALTPTADSVRAFWLDGRAMASGHDGEGAMQLRTARVTAADGAGPSELLDERVCECCPLAAAAGARGPAVLYRNRSDEEVRDIAVVRRATDGWSAPELVAADGWTIAGCPVNGPAIAADGDATAVAWFTGAGGTAAVKAAWSTDGGLTFSPPIPIASGRVLGRVGVAMDGAGGALVSWLELVEGDDAAAELRLRRIDASGATGPPRAVLTTGAQRAAGVPRIARLGDRLALAWVEPGEPSRLRVATLAAGAP